MTDHNLSARAWATAAVGAVPFASFFGVGWWVPVHMAMLGAATQAIVGGQLMFSSTLGMTRGPTRRSTLPQLVLLNIGAVLIVAHRLWETSRLFLLGATLIVVTICWVTVQVARMWRLSVNRRFSLTGTFYVLAGTSFIVGGSIGGALGSGAITHGPTFIEHRIMHMILNVFGWAGLTIAGTLVTLLPTIMHVRAPKLDMIRAVPWIMLAGLVTTATGLAFDVPAVASAGMAVYLAGLFVIGRYVRSVIGTPRRRKVPTAALHLIAAVVWGLGTALAVTFSLARADVPMTRDFIVVGGAAGFVFQALLGAWSFLLPSTRAPVPDRRRLELVAMDIAGYYQVIAYNIGLIVVLIGLRSSMDISLAGIVLAWSAAAIATVKLWFFPMLTALRSVQAASDARWAVPPSKD